MRLIPEQDEREWLIRYLRKLIAKSGAERFLCAPIVEPARQFFPEPWSGSIHDVHIVTQRLMHYAGLSDLRVHMTTFGTSSDGHTAGWFAGIRDGQCSFGVSMKQLRDPEAAGGVMAHEVAHAWRKHHHLVADHNDREELLTDLTTIYLGFGILTTNNTDRYRSSGTWSETRWSTSSVGYLPPDSMSFLLALQAYARGRKHEIRAILKHLEPNQKACFEESIEALDHIDVRAQLGLPESNADVWQLQPIDIDPPEEDELAEPPKPAPPSRTRNADTVAYARHRGHGLFVPLLAMLPGAVLGALVGLAIPGDSWLNIAPILIGAIATSLYAFNHLRQLVCTECGTTLADNNDVCAGCGATIREILGERELNQYYMDRFERRSAEIEFEE